MEGQTLLARAGCNSGVSRYFYLGYVFSRFAAGAVGLDHVGTDRESGRPGHDARALVDRHLHLDRLVGVDPWGFDEKGGTFAR